ncbi:fibronectin type-III domain-containing protein 3A isoform X2 [Gouania willdenowi]|uniref:Fibronectin type-III domain-containing protein 3A n=1 Tax=Gouania willdenowi TaxID=441366 RepID=A0A8C5E757_GOUWI|nr:fibronectin type-III domain-containing protein 3A isoform X2 [Gouania willdenowi]
MEVLMISVSQNQSLLQHEARLCDDFHKSEVILVQVNPGEAFTIRREDGQFQCITGPAQVPMMSPNGSVPPIYVPPGYVSQIIEENGVRRVLVLPQQPEFHPGGHSPLHHPPPPPHTHLPAFIPHPAMMPPPPHMYTGMAGGVGDMSSQYISQYHPAHIYSEQVSADSHPQHGRPLFVHRDDRTSKTHERLQKKLKERQGGGGGGCGQVKDSPPSSPQKSCGSPPTTDIHNGVGGKVLETEQQGQLRHTVVSSDKQTAKGKNGESLELDKEAQAMQALLSTISKPEVSDIQARGAVVKWSGPTRPEGESSINVEDKPNPLSYEVSISISGNDGNYQSVHSGEELSATLQDLRPATDYHVRVRALCNCLQGSPSEAASFTTLSCEPDLPNPPRKTSGTKNTLVLQWKAPCDNGSKIQNYILQWDEGKGTDPHEQCYYGPLKQYRLTKLSPATRYSFRLAAKNDMGVSEFSEVVEMFTSCSVPLPPLPPELEVAGVTWLCLKWQRPSSSPKEDDINYVLEMEEDGLGYGFQPSYDGDELTFTVRSLHRSTKYKFRVAAYNSEGKSNPSPVVEFITHPDRPSSPCRPVIRGRVLPHSFKMVWEPPKDDGGAEVTKYVVELSEGLSGVSWGLAYSGSAMDHVCDGLKPGCTYQTRVYCISEGGQSPLSETLQVQTPAVPPGPCQPPRLAGKPKAREVQLRWAPPQVDGGSPVSSYSLEASEPQCEESREVYQGPDMDCSVGGLMPGRTYCFRLKAANKAGFGPLSERCEVTTGPGAPEQCRIPSTTCKSPTCVVVSWESPQCNGAPVTEFRLEWGAVEGSMQVCYSGPAFSHEMKGLLPATSYFCRVQAVNVAGVGPFSDAVHCQTPCSVPAGVSSIYILKEAELRPEDEEDEDEEEEESGTRPAPMYSPSTCLGICWDPPCDHGSPITSYLIDLGERQPIVVGPVTKHVIQHLQPDTSYRIRIQALNSLGAGPFSHTFKMKTKPLPPPPPRLECTAFSHQTLRLKWGDGPTKSASSDALQYQLQMGDRNGRFISMYKGPCHIHKVQRLNESTSYTFRIQAFNEAGEGPFSSVYTFTTPRSPPAPVKAPKVERLDDNSCEVTWEALPPMKGDPVIYTLQSMMGNSEFKQAYKGSSTSFHIHNLQPNSDYRFRVCAIRQCQDAPELSGPYSPTVTLSPQRVDATPGGASAAALASRTGAESSRSRQSLTDEQCAFLLLMVFAVIAILIAFVIQYFVIK